PDRQVGAGQTDRWLASRHPLRPTGPVIPKVADQPQHALLVLVGRTAAYPAQQPAHGSPLPHRMDATKQWPALARTNTHPLPQHPVFVPVDEGFIQVANTGSTALDDC